MNDPHDDFSDALTPPEIVAIWYRLNSILPENAPVDGWESGLMVWQRGRETFWDWRPPK